MKGYKKLNKKKIILKKTDMLSKQIFSLPMYPELPNKDIENVINILKKY